MCGRMFSCMYVCALPTPSTSTTRVGRCACVRVWMHVRVHVCMCALVHAHARMHACNTLALWCHKSICPCDGTIANDEPRPSTIYALTHTLSKRDLPPCCRLEPGDGCAGAGPVPSHRADAGGAHLQADQVGWMAPRWRPAGSLLMPRWRPADASLAPCCRCDFCADAESAVAPPPPPPTPTPPHPPRQPF